jgi:glycosyltransferase involved in cell wall biosynthesis
MKVLMLTPSYDPIIGGTETVIKNLTIYLNKIGVETDVITFNMDKKWEPKWKWEIREENGFKVYRIHAFNPFKKIPNPMGFFFKVHVIPNPSFRKIIKDYDILHFHDDVDLTFPLFSYFVKKPKVFQCHTLELTLESYRKNMLSRCLFKNIADMHTSFSNYSLKLLHQLGIPKNKTNLLPNGVDVHKFRADQEKKIPNLILFVGRMERWKGLHVLLKSLLNIDIPVHLIIIGPNYNDSYFREIIELINKIKEKKNHKIAYLNSVSDEELVKWYQRASVFVWPSLAQTEAFGVVTAEALSCETPVVASTITSRSDDTMLFVEDQKNGIIVQQNDMHELAEAMQYLLYNEDVRIKFGKEGRRHIAKYFSWETVVKRLYNIYKELLKIK